MAYRRGELQYGIQERRIAVWHTGEENCSMASRRGELQYGIQERRIAVSLYENPKGRASDEG